MTAFVKGIARKNVRENTRDVDNIYPEPADPTPPNVAPVLAAIEAGALAYTEGDGAVAVTSALTVADVDNTTCSTATVTISGGYQSSEDMLGAMGNGTIQAVWTSGTGVLSLTGVDSLAQYQAVLRSVTYTNSSQDPNTGNRTVTYKVNDGADDSNTQARTVTVAAVNDAPTIASVEGSQLPYVEGDGAVAITATAVLADVDDVNLTGVVCQLTGNYSSGEDLLDYTTGSGIAKAWDSGTGKLTLSNSATIAAYQAALRTVTFSNSGTPPASTALRTVTITADDGTDTSTGATRDIDVSASGTPDLTLTTTDGMEFIFAADGEITSMKDGANTIAKHSTQKGGWYLNDFGNVTTNLVVNGDFESGSTGWSLFSGVTIESGSTNYLQCVSSGPTAQAVGAVTTLTPGRSYVIHFRYQSTTGTPIFHIIAQPQGAGEGWDLIDGDDYGNRAAAFDPGVSSGVGTWTRVSHTFQLRADQTGIKLNPKQVGTGTFLVDDIVIEDLDAEGDRLTQTHTAGGSEVTVSGADATHEVTLTATITETADHLRYTGTLLSTSTGNPDRALMLSYCVPIDPAGFTHYPSFDASEAYVSGTEFSYLKEKPAYNDQNWFSYSPNLCASVEDGTVGVSIGHHHEKPAQVRYGFGDEGLWIRYQLGTSNSSKVPNTAEFDFAIYKHDTLGWGMREGSRKYRSVVPSVFVDRDATPTGHGVSTFGVTEATTAPADFGARYEFAGWRYAGLSVLQDAGLLLLQHPNPSEWHLAGTPELTLAEKHTMLDATKSGMELGTAYTWPVTGGTYTHRQNPNSTYEVQRQALINSAFEDADGEWTDFTFSAGLDFLGCCCHPDIATPNVVDQEDLYKIQPAIAIAEGASAVFYGFDYDNMSLVPGRASFNYRTSQWALFDTPLSWDHGEKAVFSYNHWTYGEYLKAQAETMHARSPTPGFLTGNIASNQNNAISYLWTHNAKVGGEFKWDHTVRRENLRTQRMIAGTKCCNQILTSGDTAAIDSIDEVFSYSYLYASWPAIPGLNYVVADFTAPNRAICQTYFPTMRLIDNAGWQDIPYVTSPSADIYIERFGTYAGGDLHFVVHNASDSEIAGEVITIDRTSLGIATDSTDWDDLWPTGGTQTGIAGTITVTVPAKRSIVFAVTLES